MLAFRPKEVKLFSLLWIAVRVPAGRAPNAPFRYRCPMAKAAQAVDGSVPGSRDV
jgi:hypothetical protein